VTVDSDIRDFEATKLAPSLHEEGRLVQRQAGRGSVDALSETAGCFGYAFADVRPNFRSRQRKADDER
jgi:outer membrane protein insertion porin family